MISHNNTGINKFQNCKEENKILHINLKIELMPTNLVKIYKQ